MTEVTGILSAIEQGDPHAAEQLLPLVYEELRKLAAQKLAQEKPGQTLQATALVHEAYVRLVDEHGGDRRRLPLDDLSLQLDDSSTDLLSLDEALTALAQKEPVKAELVKLRYFAGLSLEEAAACLEISPATAKRYWAVARAWLYSALSDRGDGGRE
jgi:hypothetical protein